MDFGEKCFEQHYHAKEPSEIIDFIKNVVIDENDIKFESRKSFANSLMCNFPNAAIAITKYIKDNLRISL